MSLGTFFVITLTFILGLLEAQNRRVKKIAGGSVLEGDAAHGSVTENVTADVDAPDAHVSSGEVNGTTER